MIFQKNKNKTGRNDLCPCGSQKKYKVCCLELKNGALNDKAMNGGLIKQQAGKYSESDSDIKMSQVILHLVEDILESVSEREEFESAVILGIIAWNLSHIPEENRYEVFGQFFLGMLSESSEEEYEGHVEKFQDNQEGFYTLVCTLIAKKHMYYPHVHRFLTEYNITESEDGGFELNIMSMAREEDLPVAS